MIKPTTIELKENPDNGHVQITMTIKHPNGESITSYTLTEYAIGDKVEQVAAAIEGMLYEVKNDGTLEGEFAGVYRRMSETYFIRDKGKKARICAMCRMLKRFNRVPEYQKCQKHRYVFKR